MPNRPENPARTACWVPGYVLRRSVPEGVKTAWQKPEIEGKKIGRKKKNNENWLCAHIRTRTHDLGRLKWQNGKKWCWHGKSPDGASCIKEGAASLHVAVLDSGRYAYIQYAG